MQTQQNTIPPTFSLLHGDCLEKLATLRDNSIDAVVTDPPYGLGEAPDALAMLRDWLETGHHEVKSKRGFMGKTWDNFVPQPRVWHEVFRVLKPGGHVLAFAGTRTQDLMALGLRLAGFEIRDLVAWVYGSGFPKSLDVSKALDRMAGSVGENTLDLKREIRRRYEAAGMTLRQFNELCGFEASGYLRETGTWASVLPSAEKWAQMKSVLKCDGELDALFAAAEREIVGYQKRGNSLNTDFMSGGNDITIPATDAAKQWEGWGTALKPALEPITLARKPLEGTVAANMLKWHTGALNVDACRVEHASEADRASATPQGKVTAKSGALAGKTQHDGERSEFDRPDTSKGRWPANLIHDGSEDVVTVFPDSKGQLAPSRSDGAPMDNAIYGAMKHGTKSMIPRDDGDNKSAARFFYCAKVSPSERNAGLSDLPDKEWKADGAAIPQRTDRPFKPSKNNHPTVKPLALMRYLCRLITPPSGTILDPYLGSGSTGVAALQEGFDFIGIEREEEYFTIATARIDNALKIHAP